MVIFVDFWLLVLFKNSMGAEDGFAYRNAAANLRAIVSLI